MKMHPHTSFESQWQVETLSSTHYYRETTKERRSEGSSTMSEYDVCPECGSKNVEKQKNGFRRCKDCGEEWALIFKEVEP